MPVEVQLACSDSSGVDSAHLQACAAAAMQAVHRDLAELCIRVVDEPEIEALNTQYRGKPQPTNVLSFPADVPLEQIDLLGDVVLCGPVIERQASEQGKTIEDHFAHMVVHGVLHLAGYDHEQDEEAQEMESLEVSILRKLGIGDPYHE